MADATVPTIPAALAVVGATAGMLNPSEGTMGNPVPAEPKTGPTPVAPTAEETAALAVTAEAEAKVVADAAEQAPLNTETWGSTGNAVGDSVLALLQNAGVTTEEAKALLFDAVSSGDITKVDRAALEAKIGKDKANLVMAGAGSYLVEAKAAETAILSVVHTAVGGDANWKAITVWAKEAVSAADIKDYVSMIDAGGAKARFAATELATLYNADTKNTTLDAAKAVVIPSASAPTAGRATDRKTYVSELSKAHSHGATPAVLAEIQAARERGRTKGL